MRKPHFIAEQGRRPHGLLGRVVAAVMARETAAENDRAIGLLDIRHGDCVLDVGTGHGRSLARISRLAQAGLVTGVDESALMVGLARKRNRVAIEEGRIRVEAASSRSLPFADNTFDRVLSVHTLYFWDPVEPNLAEIRRVMKPGGRLVLAFRPAEDRATVERFPADIYRFRTVDEVLELISRTGLALDRVERRDVPGNSMIWVCASSST